MNSRWQLVCTDRYNAFSNDRSFSTLQSNKSPDLDLIFILFSIFAASLITVPGLLHLNTEHPRDPFTLTIQSSSSSISLLPSKCRILLRGQGRAQLTLLHRVGNLLFSFHIIPPAFSPLVSSPYSPICLFGHVVCKYNSSSLLQRVISSCTCHDDEFSVSVSVPDAKTVFLVYTFALSTLGTGNSCS
jgi:hypothetical protein